jgi:hypothetical protein
MGRGINSPGDAGRHGYPSLGQTLRQFLGDAKPSRRGAAGTHHRDLPPVQQRRVAEDGDHRRGILGRGEEGTVGGVAEVQPASAHLQHRVVLPPSRPRVGGAQALRRQPVQRGLRAAVAREQPAEGLRPDPLAPRGAEAGERFVPRYFPSPIRGSVPARRRRMFW